MKRFLFLLFAVCFSLPPQSGGATLPFGLGKLSGNAESSPSDAKKAPDETEVLAWRDAALEESRQAEAALAALSAEAPASEAQYWRDRLQALERLKTAYDALSDTFVSLQRVDARLRETERLLQEWRTGVPPKNFKADFSTLDKLQSQEIEAQKSLRSREEIYKARQKAVDEAKGEFDEAESARRRAREAAAAAPPAEKIEKENALTLAQLNSRLGEARVLLRQFELQVSRRYRELSDRQRELAGLQMAYLKNRVAFDQEALDRELGTISLEASGLDAAIAKAQKALPAAEKEYSKARQRLDQSGLPSPALIEEVEARRLEQNLFEQQISAWSERLKRLKENERLWKERFELLSGQADLGRVRVWREQTRQALDEIKRNEDLLSLRLNSMRNSLAEARQKAGARADADSATQAWMKRQQELLQQNLDLLQDNQAALITERKFGEALLYEQQQRLAHISWGERLQRVWGGFLAFWNFEITSVDDASITIGKVLVALILVLFGGFLARFLSHWLAERILPRFGVNAGVAAALRSLSFYLLFLSFFIFALNVVKVPLTLFAVLGGAIAIGVGFGSQNLVNNFISGLILLIERPIKVDDVIQVENMIGKVERIGGRSTVIRTADNTHFIVPNSSFLEKVVSNWTLYNDMMRCVLRVGVAYGSSPRQVADLLRKVADDHGKLLKNPKPMVIFQDFGNDALIFDLYYWIKMRAIGDRRELESDLRFMIASALEEAGITVPFPQRDVHLHAATPLELKISRATAKKELPEEENQANIPPQG